ncbi:hypothetical protein ACHAXR_000738, partial [Thalassiosira sp. AJA248-18]
MKPLSTLLFLFSVSLINYSIISLNFKSNGGEQQLLFAAPRYCTSAQQHGSITSYWWPSVEDGGLLGKIYAVQNPADCKSPSTKFLLWQSGEQKRGLTAW